MQEALVTFSKNTLVLVTDQYIGNLLKRDLLFGFVTFLKELFVDCGWPKQVAGIPIAVSISITFIRTQSEFKKFDVLLFWSGLRL